MTFRSPSFVPDYEFECKTVELWGLIPKEKLRFVKDEIEAFLKGDPEHKKSVLDNKDSTFILDLIGKGYSAMVRE
jgi:hypothetical protein